MATDDTRPEPEIQRFSKMEAARRQLNTAIWLWFKDGDMASVHTLTGAAFGILHDLYQHRHKSRPIPFDEKYMPKGYEKVIRNMLKEDETFFKHARKDPNAIHELPTEWTGIYLITTVRVYSDLMGESESLHPLMSLLTVWFRMTRPDIFFDDAPPLVLKLLDVERVKNLSKVEFFAESGGPFLPEPPYTALAKGFHPLADP
jgi:hypothetical protein